MTAPAAKGGRPKKVQHWKHGWIPLDAYARGILADRKKKAAKKKGELPDKPKVQKLSTAQHMAEFGTPNVPRKDAGPQMGGMAGAMAMMHPEGFIGNVDRTSEVKSDIGHFMSAGGEVNLTFDPPISGDEIKKYLRQSPKPLIRRTDQASAALMDAIRTDGGFTFDPKKGGLIKVGESAGFVVAIPGTEHIIGHEKVNGEDVTREDFAKGVAAVITEHRDLFEQGAVLGGWYSPERNEYMVEISQIMPPGDRDAAIKLATERNQEAVFDLSTGDSIFVGGTGDAPTATYALSAFQDKLSPEEVAAAKYYTGPGYAPINNALRAGDSPPPAAAFYMNKLDAAMSKSVVDKDETAYRGVWGGDWLPKVFAPGDTMQDAGYLSTAVDPNGQYDGDTKMVIRVPKGTNAIDLDGTGLTHHANEKELLLPRGTKLRVISDLPDVGGKRIINLEVVQ